MLSCAIERPALVSGISTKPWFGYPARLLFVVVVVVAVVVTAIGMLRGSPRSASRGQPKTLSSSPPPPRRPRAQMFAVLLAMGQSIAAAAVPTTTKSAMEQRADTPPHGALMGDVCFVHLYLADMSHFADVNRV